jgi:5-methylcytosine-specific restriction endonuclease McrA
MTKRGVHKPTRDRIIPGRHGGTYSQANVAIVCNACNGDKGQWTLPAYHAALQAEGDPRAPFVLSEIRRLQRTGE